MSECPEHCYSGTLICCNCEDRFDADDKALLEEEVDLWRERTSIPEGEWSICIPHNSAYQTNEGCLRCKLTAIECGDCGLTMLECKCDDLEDG